MKPFILTSMLVLMGSTAAAQEACDPMPDESSEIAAAKLFIENNAADEDIGIHGLLDDNGWAELCVFDPAGVLVMHVMPQNQLGDLGIGSFFFESREPPVEEWDYPKLKAAFAEGDYEVRAIAYDGTGREGSARFTTVVPTMPVITAPELVEDPEKEEPPVLPMGEFTVAWDKVTGSLDDRPVNITGYEVIVTDDDYEDADGMSRPVYDVHLGPKATELVVPAAFLTSDTLYEVEVLAIEESGNQTIALGFFKTGK